MFPIANCIRDFGERVALIDNGQFAVITFGAFPAKNGEIFRLPLAMKKTNF